MGYSHGWNQSLALSSAGWAAVRTDVIAIVNHAEKHLGIPLAGEGGRKGTRPFLGGSIGFNGVKPDDCESIHITATPGDLSAASVKTRKKPYDVVVTALLIYLESVAKSHDVASTDGVRSDWLPGLNLALAALPQYREQLELPFIVRERMRWCGRLMFAYVDYYRFNLCTDGKAYVIRDTDGASFCFSSHGEALKFAEKHHAVLKPDLTKLTNISEIANAQRNLLDKLLAIAAQTGRNTPPPPVPTSEHRTVQQDNRFIAYID